MDIATLVNVLDQPHQAAAHLQGWGLRDQHRGHQILVELAESGLTIDLLTSLCDQLAKHLPAQAGPDLALETLRRFLFASRSPLALGALIQRDASALPLLLKTFSIGPRWREILIADPEAFDLLRMTESQPTTRQALFGDIGAEAARMSDDRLLGSVLRRFQERELLRIAYGDIVGRQSFHLVSEQLTALGEALLETALEGAQRQATPAARTATKAAVPNVRLAIIAVGRLGGELMDYSNQLELLFLYDPPAEERLRPSVHDQAERVARLCLRYLTGGGEEPQLFAVRLLALPDSQATTTVHAADDVVLGFDSFGRTWHRQTMLQARGVAGDRELAQRVIGHLQPWLFRRYMSRADESGVKALKRRVFRRPIDQSTLSPGKSRGGLLDIENTVHFLQLLVGGEHELSRASNVLTAIAGLEQAGVISPQERTLLEESYAWLRQIEHRLQVTVSDACENLADDQAAAIARSIGLLDGSALLDECRAKLARVWSTCRKILEGTFADSSPPAVVDLLLDPGPSSGTVQEVLEPYGFQKMDQALSNLQSLAIEPVPFLSTRRCRHVLTLIAEPLLTAIGKTPDPDSTLTNLARVSNGLGSKGVLWDLFRFHPPSLDLYVRLCAASPYLSGILTASPGMIDDLVDSLQLDTLPTLAELKARFRELARAGIDQGGVLHDLKNASHLRIGVRDILGKEQIAATHRALADVAEFCVAEIAEEQYASLVERFGAPRIGLGPREGEPCNGVLLGLGKLGGREPNYHSELGLAFLYEAEGTTAAEQRSRRQPTTNNHFFTQLAQRVLKQLTDLTPKGRLYPVDVPLRPIGLGGAMAISLADFSQHFSSGAAPVWQWQALCKARPIHGPADSQQHVQELIRQQIAGRPWKDSDLLDIYEARMKSQRGAAPLNLKRGRGGTMDVEALVQMLQLRLAAQNTEILQGGTIEALHALKSSGFLSGQDAAHFEESYQFLRRTESALRLLNTAARHDLPEVEPELRKLGLLLHEDAATLRTRCEELMAENRRRFDRLFATDGK